MIVKGGITEVVGPPSSGRTSLLVSWLGAVTRAGAAAALVDADQAFDPASAARAGVDLSRLLWVRCGGRRDVALRAADLLVRCPGFALVALDLGEAASPLPLAVAFRLKLAARRTGTALVIAAGRRLTGPGASVALRTVRRALEWAGPGEASTRLARLGAEVQVLRARGGTSLEEGSTTTWWLSA